MRTGVPEGVAALEDAVLGEAVDQMAAAVEKQLARAAQASDPGALSDPNARLDAQIALLSRGRRPGADEAAVREVLEATGYSFAQGRTDPTRLRLTGP